MVLVPRILLSGRTRLAVVLSWHQSSNCALARILSGPLVCTQPSLRQLKIFCEACMPSFSCTRRRTNALRLTLDNLLPCLFDAWFRMCSCVVRASDGTAEASINSAHISSH
ncbi:hypothetical protein IWX92DRAFT_36205 [Phyllosticta citricarpa]